MNKLYAYKYWDGVFWKLIFCRVDDLSEPFIREPEYDTYEQEKKDG